MKIVFKLFLPVLLTGLIIQSCNKEEIITRNLPSATYNPYDTIDYSTVTIGTNPIDPNTFLGLHTYIFSTKCAVPACHDGSFEPDFRTVQSSYQTLVYYPNLKNTIDSSFNYRVVPGKSDSSWLYERVITEDQVLGRMPLYDTLSASRVANIKNWIDNGALDIFGNQSTLWDYQPSSFGMLAYLPDAGNMRIDTIRMENIVVYPFFAPYNANVKLWFGLYDLTLNGDFVLPTGFTFNKVKFSVNDPYDFSNATELNLTKELIPFMGPTLYGGGLAPYFYHITINTGNYQTNDIIYFRVYVDDGQHNGPTEIPREGSQFYLQTYFSFSVQ